MVYLSVEAPFGPDCILEMARWVEKNPPPGKYSVPELGLENVSFAEILYACYRNVKREWDKLHQNS